MVEDKGTTFKQSIASISRLPVKEPEAKAKLAGRKQHTVILTATPMKSLLEKNEVQKDFKEKKKVESKIKKEKKEREEKKKDMPIEGKNGSKVTVQKAKKEDVEEIKV